MPPPQVSSYNAVVSGAVINNGVETVIATTKPVSSSFPGCQIAIRFSIEVTVGVGATGVTLRIRRDSLTGTAVFGPAAFPCTASFTNPYTIEQIDSSPGDTASQVWVCTATIVGGAANGTNTFTFSSVLVGQ